MSVFINETCINCGACIDECPVEAIVDNDDCPNNTDIHFVYDDKCVECVGFHDMPACATACPVESCITWDLIGRSPAHREDIGEDKRIAKADIL